MLHVASSGVLQVCQSSKIMNIPGGHVVVLPGYTMEHATCGLFKACTYRLVSLIQSSVISQLTNHNH